MLIIDYFTWWYGKGLTVFFLWWKNILGFINYYLTPGEMLRTLFYPWKRDVVFYGESLDQKLKAILDNLVSRFIGFILRFFVLISFVVIYFIIIITLFFSVLVWLSLVPLSVFLIIWGFRI